MENMVAGAWGSWPYCICNQEAERGQNIKTSRLASSDPTSSSNKMPLLNKYIQPVTYRPHGVESGGCGSTQTDHKLSFFDEKIKLKLGSGGAHL